MGLRQFRTIKTPCCRRTIRIQFPYGQLKSYLIYPYCYAHFIVTFSKIKSKRKNEGGEFRAYKLIKKKLIEDK